MKIIASFKWGEKLVETSIRFQRIPSENFGRKFLNLLKTSFRRIELRRFCGYLWKTDCNIRNEFCNNWIISNWWRKIACKNIIIFLNSIESDSPGWG
jgi:hypothetical protein